MTRRVLCFGDHGERLRWEKASRAGPVPARRPPPRQDDAVVADENRLVTVVLRVTDLDAALALYGVGFGLDLHLGDHHGDDPWTSGRHGATSWTEGAFLHFALYEAPEGGATSGAQIALRVADLDAAHRRAVAAGARVLHEPKAQPWGRSARYADADGNVIELTEPPG